MPGPGKMCHCPLVRSSTTQRQFPHRPPQYMPISVIARLRVRLHLGQRGPLVLR
jgi:hypothetical protein